MLFALIAAVCVVQSGVAPTAQDIVSNRPRPGGPLKIVRATYGVPGQTVDITTRIAQLVHGETLWMRVGAAETGPDPVPNAVKTLTVTYTYKGKTENASAKDRQSLAIGSLPGPSGQSGALRIIRAEYGPLDKPAGVRDVANRIVAAVKGDGLKMVVNDRAMGVKTSAPALKWIRILYAHRGLVKTATVPEGWILAIGDVPPSRTPNSELRIVKAEFGPANTTDLSRDVTSLVSLAIAGDSLRMVARQDVLGDDTMPGAAKSLTVDYVYRGENRTATIPENGVLEIGPMPPTPPHPASLQAEASSPGLRILSAEYCSMTHQVKPHDVTDLLASKVKEQGLELNVETALMGHDPDPNSAKFLRVTYVLNGRVATVTVPENKPLAIGSMPMPKDQLSDALGAMNSGPLHIMFADYGALDQEGLWVDVTEKVSRLVRGGSLHFGLVELNEEPAVNVLKNVRILYVFNGRVGITIKNDLEQVNIGSGAP